MMSVDLSQQTRSQRLLSSWLSRGWFISALSPFLLSSLMITPAAAQSDPLVSVDRPCIGAGGIGEVCTPEGGECGDNLIANACVANESGARQCRPSCLGDDGLPDELLCSFGELCTHNVGGSGVNEWYCKSVPFQMDLNLLDQCIQMWLEGIEPNWSNNQCDLAANLNRLLDQNEDLVFDIFDLDLCVLSFLERPEPADELLCSEDEECARGLYCDQDYGACVRDCGLVSSREEDIESFERGCSGPLQVCDFNRGRCVPVTREDLGELTCETSRDCGVQGAYCFLGRCTPHCYRALDCPSSAWYCTDTNQCRVLPSPEVDGEGFEFKPDEYVIRFARKRLDLDAIKTRDEVQLAIMSLISRQQVRENPAVSFGYRLLTDYAMKEDLKCLYRFPEDCSDASQRERIGSSDTPETEAECEARKADCIIDQTEQWLRIPSPFGVVSASGVPKLDIELEDAVADQLSPGVYRVKLGVVYDNGSTDELQVYYNKRSPSGDYAGSYTVYYGDEPSYSLSGLTPLNMAWEIQISDEITTWDELVEEVGDESLIEDVARGNKVYAYLDAAQSIAFAKPKLSESDQRTDHRIPFLGVYYPEQGLLRLIGRVVLPETYLESEAGVNAEEAIRARNLFHRDIERRIELFGPFDETSGSFSGRYSEEIRGVAPSSISLNGGFVLTQRVANENVINQSTRNNFDLLSRPTDFDPTFPDQTALLREVEAEIAQYCFSTNEKNRFNTKLDLDQYLTHVQRVCDPASSNVFTCINAVYSDLITFSDLIGEALGSLGSQNDAAELTVYDFLRGRILTCPEEQECANDNECSDGFKCLPETGSDRRCVRQKSELYQYRNTCDTSSDCSDAEVCDESARICLARGLTCDANVTCGAGQRCVSDSRASSRTSYCVDDVTNHSCIEVTASDLSSLKTTCTPHVGLGCYWMENTSGNYCWVPAPQGSVTEARCQQLDSCSASGGGASGGGCYKWASFSSPVSANVCRDYGQREGCYWMENTSGNYCWIPAPQRDVTEARCQQLDSCSGGGGASGGGCYRWGSYSDLGSLSNKLSNFMDLTDTTLDDLKLMTSGSATGGNTLCVDVNTPPEFQSYSAYFGNEDAACVSETNARCGLALHQKALLSGSPQAPWIKTSQFEVAMALGLNEAGDALANPTLPLFCDDAINLSGCIDRPDLSGTTAESEVEKTRFILQEHNRFWLHLVQALKFKGDDHLTNAFLTLYRHQVNPFTRSAAFAYKAEQQAIAFDVFDKILTIFAAPSTVQVLESWPIKAYLQRGNDWLAIMHGIVADRMETLASIVDLDRRVFLERSLQGKYDILQNAIQIEYLFQAYLLWQQIEWQRDVGHLVPYEGKAEAIFREGQAILNQMNVNRNDLGVFDNQVYFEQVRGAGDLRPQWRLYYDLLMGADGDGGIFGEAQTAVNDAVSELKASLSDLDALEEKIFAARREISGYIAEQCGPSASELDAMFASSNFGDLNGDRRTDYCDYLLSTYPPSELVKNIRDCKLRGEDCSKLGTSAESFQFKCNGANDLTGGFGYGGDACEAIIEEFVNNTDAILSNSSAGNGLPNDLVKPPRCDLNALAEHKLSLGGRQRLCTGGEMGKLIQERRKLEFSREQVVGSVETLIKKIADDLGTGAALAGNCLSPDADGDGIDSCSSSVQSHWIADKILADFEWGYNALLAIQDIGKESTDDILRSINCQVVIGFSNGTSCPQSIASGAGQASGEIIGGAAKTIIDQAFLYARLIYDISESSASLTRAYGGIKREIYQQVREVDDLITQFQTLTQEIFNMNFAIDNLKYQIQANYATYQDDIRFALDHILGRETGNLLRGRRLVIDSDEKFRRVLQYGYRMLMAFQHDYNLSSAQISNLKNKLIGSVTLDDVRDFVDELERYELEYCGREGLDCDSAHNVETLRVSLRDRLFPSLRDTIGGDNRVITAGEQFHNSITSSPYLKQTILNGRPMQVIELKFTLPIDMQEYGPQGPNWLINPLECNHLLVSGFDPENRGPGEVGNIAVNIKGLNLGEGERTLRYEMIRGGIDLMRACHAESVTRELGLPPVLEYPIRAFTIGYAPQSNEAQLAEPRSFVTRSGNMTGCVNSGEVNGDLDGTCWRFFARGRSLSAMDWTIRIPITIEDALTENAWVMGTGLTREQRPLIEDIIVYLRYRSRPTNNE